MPHTPVWPGAPGERGRAWISSRRGALRSPRLHAATHRGPPRPPRSRPPRRGTAAGRSLRSHDAQSGPSRRWSLAGTCGPTDGNAARAGGCPLCVPKAAAGSERARYSDATVKHRASLEELIDVAAVPLEVGWAVPRQRVEVLGVREVVGEERPRPRNPPQSGCIGAVPVEHLLRVL